MTDSTKGKLRLVQCYDSKNNLGCSHNQNDACECECHIGRPCICDRDFDVTVGCYCNDCGGIVT